MKPDAGAAEADSYNPRHHEPALPIAANRMTRAPIDPTETVRPRTPPRQRAWLQSTAAPLLALLLSMGGGTWDARAATPGTATAAPATAPLVVPAATAAAASEPPMRDASADIAGLTEAVRQWAAAWSRKDTEAYIAAYVPGFKGGEASAAAWQASRRDRIVGKGRISVEVSNIVVLIGKSQKSATFTQVYAADALRQSNRKTLEFEQRDGRWLIVRETSATTAPTRN